MENPFTLTFGQKPTEFISRTNQIGKIIHTFDMENPSNKVIWLLVSGDLERRFLLLKLLIIILQMINGLF